MLNAACQWIQRVTLNIPVVQPIKPMDLWQCKWAWQAVLDNFPLFMGVQMKIQFIKKSMYSHHKYQHYSFPSQKCQALLRKENLYGVRGALTFQWKAKFSTHLLDPISSPPSQIVCSCCYYPYQIELLILHLYSIISIWQYSMDSALFSIMKNSHAARPNEYFIVINSNCH